MTGFPDGLFVWEVPEQRALRHSHVLCNRTRRDVSRVLQTCQLDHRLHSDCPAFIGRQMFRR